MKRLWIALEAWIDARESRERLLLFVSAIVVPGVLLQALLVQPALTERKRMTLETQTDQGEIAKMTVQLQELVRSRSSDPDAALRARLVDIQASMAEIQRQADAQTSELVSPEKMAGVLEKILASAPRIRVVEVKVLPRTSTSFDKLAPAAPAAGVPVVVPPAAAAVAALVAPGLAGAAAGAPQEPKGAPTQERKANEIFRHGVEITLRGNFLDLVAYLKEIESQPVRMFWDKVSLSVSGYPVVTMRVVVYTISMEKAWLTV